MQKYVLICLLTLGLAPLAHAQQLDAIKDIFPFSNKIVEVSLNHGYTDTSLSSENPGDYENLLSFMHVGYDLNGLIPAGEHGQWQLAFEPLFNTLISPKNGAQIGMGIGLKYNYRVTQHIGLFIDAGVAPMYMTINTHEQGHAGFNFLDHVGGGLYWHFNDTRAITAGYRLQHVSHADIRDSANRGINSDAFYVGFSQFF